MGFSTKATGKDSRQPDLGVVREALPSPPDHEAGYQLQWAPGWLWRTFAAGEIDQAVTWVEENSPTATGVYWTINPVPPTLDRSIHVGDVLRRRWILVDIDRAKTRADAKDSATDQEHQAALNLADRIWIRLSAMGWPDPVATDSGNGAHLYYPIDLENDDPSRVLVRDLLAALAVAFDGLDGTVGKECHDARRVAKLPGTWARRGVHSAERPHRMARLIHVPAQRGLVTPDMIREATQALRQESPPVPQPASPEPTPPRPPLKLPRWVVIARDAPESLEEAYARKALDSEVSRMAGAPVGDRNNQLFRSGAAMGNLIASGLLEEEEVVGALLSAARQAGCDSPGKDEATIRRGIAAGRTTPRAPPTLPTQATPPSTNGRAPKAAEEGPRIWTITEILSTEFPPPRWAVPGILSEGLTILAGKPKLGKSWVALNLGLTIAAGGSVLGTIRVLAGDVLYLALEDRARRLKDRATKVLSGLPCLPSDRLHIATDWPRMGQGGLELLDVWLQAHSECRLAIVDVWSKFRPPSVGGRSSSNAYQADYEEVSALKRIADEHRTSVLLLHHTKKGQAEDAIEEISGTMGISGAADGTLVLTRARGETEAELFVTGRDVEEQTLALSFDEKTFVWTSLGKAEEATESKLKAAIIALYKRNPGVIMGVREVCDTLKVPEHKQHYARNLLARLHADDVLSRVGSGKYRYPIDTEGESPF